MTAAAEPRSIDDYPDGALVQTTDGSRGRVRTCPCGVRFVATNPRREYHDDPCKARAWRTAGQRTVRVRAVHRAVRALAEVAEPSDWDDIVECIRTVREQWGDQ